jgi:hypothetical protein
VVTRKGGSNAPSAIRDNFFAARRFADLNTQAQTWCHGPATHRRCPEDEGLSVGEAFAAEAPRLLSLPDEPFALVERVAVSVGKTLYVRFDLNDYSVPYTQVRRVLTVLADPDRLRIVDGQQVVATHPRSYSKGEQIEDPAHLAALVDHKRQAQRHRAGDRLAQAAPASQILLVRAAERGDNLGAITAGGFPARLGGAGARPSQPRTPPRPRPSRLCFGVQD